MLSRVFGARGLSPKLRTAQARLTPKISVIPQRFGSNEFDPNIPEAFEPEDGVFDCDRVQAQWLAELCAMCPAWVEVAMINYQYMAVSAKLQNCRKLIKFLKLYTHARFTQFDHLIAVDHIGQAERFELVYCFRCWDYWNHIRVHTFVDELTHVPSVTDMYWSAEALENKVYDEMGVFFKGHPDLRRIFTDYGFQGWPYRKDFPVMGYTELRYDDTLRRIVYEPIEVAQELRQYEGLSPWFGTNPRDAPFTEKGMKTNYIWSLPMFEPGVSGFDEDRDFPTREVDVGAPRLSLPPSANAPSLDDDDDEDDEPPTLTEK